MSVISAGYANAPGENLTDALMVSTGPAARRRSEGIAVDPAALVTPTQPGRFQLHPEVAQGAERSRKHRK
jgi:hypothetical protein